MSRPSNLVRAFSAAALPCPMIAGAALLTVDQSPTTTGARYLRFAGPAALRALGQVVWGRGIEGVQARPASCDYGEIVWVAIRDESDELQTRHVLYEQRPKLSPSFLSRFGSQQPPESVPLLGALIGVHSAGGIPQLVIGAQFDSVVVEALPTITRSDDAFEAAHVALLSWPGGRPPDRAAWSAELASRLRDRSRLFLVSTGQGTSFRFAWDVTSIDADERTIGLLLDAANGQLAQVVGRSMRDLCGPQPGQPGTTADGVPQNAGSAVRSLWATTTTERPDFTHEAHRLASGPGTREIRVYYGSDTAAYECQNPPWAKVGLLALKTVNGSARYENWNTQSPIISLGIIPDSPDHYLYPGSAAADAEWFTHRTMSRLWSTFGWSSYDNSGSAAIVTVNRLGAADNAEFTPTGNPGWPNSVNIGMRRFQQYSLAACLDVIAHEWTHGIAYTRGLPYNEGTEQAQLHEGFADTMGHAIEWYEQPQGQGFEHADWIMGEDNPKATSSGYDYFRRVEQPYNGEPFLFFFHKQDHPGNSDAHARGNVLAVAFRLLVVGGTNPDCSFSNCGYSVPALGLDKASHILFRVLTTYVGSNNTWPMLIDQSKSAAFDLYKFCGLGYSAIPEQQAVEQAFNAIGYGSIGYYFTCN